MAEREPMWAGSARALSALGEPTGDEHSRDAIADLPATFEMTLLAPPGTPPPLAPIPPKQVPAVPLPVPALPDRSREPRSMLVTLALVAATNVLLLAHVQIAFLGPALGFWLIVVHPAYLLFTSSASTRMSAAERVGYSVAGTLLALLLGGLLLNTALPLVGIDRPLDTIPVLVMVDAVNLVLYVFRRRNTALPDWRRSLRSMNRVEIRLVLTAGACIPLVVLGANRLNNQAGDQITLIALAMVVIGVVSLLFSSRRITSGVTGVAIYLLSAALLLMTSLRGWSVTGHDIQLEYRVFQLTAAHGRWNMGSLRGAFNACLSITILPTQISALMHVDDPYVFKVFVQLIFATCPVLVYAIARRYCTERIAILSAVYFVSFPTFFSDMPFLNRQEIALIFVASGILALTNPVWKKRRRQAALVAAAVGVELSHYSSSYVFGGTLVVAWAIGEALLLPRFLSGHWNAWRRSGTDNAGRSSRPVAGVDHSDRWADTTRTVGLGTLALVLAVMVGWGGFATHIAGGAVSEIQSAVLGRSGSAKSSAATYSLLSGKVATAQSDLNQYRKQTLRVRASLPPGNFLPSSVVDKYPVRAVEQPNLPLTGLGSALNDVGISPTSFNADLRQLAAKGEQIFVAIGVLAIIFSRRLSRKLGREYFFLCLASIFMLMLITVAPELSVDYGILRVFQEELILIAPIMVIGSITMFRPFGTVWSERLAMTICVIVLVSTIGLLPQLLGGYPAQLNLNNSGLYYDIYYTHPQEVAAISWLYGKPGTLPGGIQTDINSERFAFTSPSEVTGSQYLVDYFPTLLGRSTWVVLGYSVLETGQATTSVNGNLITYRYPIGLLEATKDLVYNNGGTRIYK